MWKLTLCSIAYRLEICPMSFEIMYRSDLALSASVNSEEAFGWWMALPKVEAMMSGGRPRLW